jgi:hypothetical protein
LTFVGVAFFAFEAATLLVVFVFADGFAFVAAFPPLLLALEAAREMGCRPAVEVDFGPLELFVMVLQREPG